MSPLQIRPVAPSATLTVTPLLDEVRQMAPEHRQVPLVHTFVSDCETPVSAFLKLRDGGPAFLLESAEEGQRLGRHSIIGIRPQAVIRAASGALTLHRADGTTSNFDAGDPFGVVEDVVNGVGMAPSPPDLVFAGGAVGYFGYDLVRRVERLPDEPPDDRGMADMVMMITGPVVIFDHLKRSVTIAVPCPLDGDVDGAYAAAVRDLEGIAATLAGPVPERSLPRESVQVGDVVSNTTQAAFD
jgi:anthranilate synthase component I